MARTAGGRPAQRSPTAVRPAMPRAVTSGQTSAAGPEAQLLGFRGGGGGGPDQGAGGGCLRRRAVSGPDAAALTWWRWRRGLAGGSTDRAIELGLARTGKLVTSGALILMFAFLVLSSSPGFEIKSLAVGIAAGIIFDATVIRALLVPALMKLFGAANWWTPTWLDRLLPAPPTPAVVDLRGVIPVPSPPVDATTTTPV